MKSVNIFHTKLKEYSLSKLMQKKKKKKKPFRMKRNYTKGKPLSIETHEKN